MYNNMIFDLDGTLTDPGTGITNSVAYALSKYNIKVSDNKELYKFIGPPLFESFSRFYGFTAEESKQCVEYYREYYRPKGIFENELYDGVEEMLKILKANGKIILLATSKPQIFAQQILEYFNLDKYFDFVSGSDLDGSRIKKSEVIAHALENAKITDLEKTVMVGDREHDIIGARETGIDSIGVLFGYGSLEEHKNAGATHIAEKVEDIIKYVL